MKNFFYRTAIICLLLVCSQSFAELPPEWIDNPSAVYDKDSYITAVGTGKDRKAAEASAINALASIFGQSVSAETKSSKSMAESADQGKKNFQGNTSISQDISLRTNVNSLMNAEIKLTWNSQDGTYYALALIDKENATAYYSREIESLFVDISELLSISEGDSLLNACMNYKTAIGLAEKQNEYMSILTVLSNSEAMLVEDKVYSTNKINRELNLLQQKVPINISVEGITGDWHNKIKKVFTAKLSEFGFKTTTKPSRYVLKCDVDIVNFKLQGNPNEMVKYFVQVALVDTDTDLELYPYSVEGQTGYQTLAGAVDRAYMLIEKKIKAEYSF